MVGVPNSPYAPVTVYIIADSVEVKKNAHRSTEARSAIRLLGAAFYRVGRQYLEKGGVEGRMGIATPRIFTEKY